ncbi:MAG: beta-N-acetylhexosaminidase, partial [Bacteroidetes bacterium]
SKRYSLKVAPRYYIDKNYKFIKGVFSTKKTKTHSIQVAQKMYINKAYRDTILNRIYRSELREKAEYKYSDLGFIMIADMLQNITGKPIQKYVENNIYKHLGTQDLGYLPLKRVNKKRIIPTQNDKFFRHQLLRGYVHDPTAALLGGISGNAGLFGNVNDLAKLMQMYLQNGSYGNEQIITDTIVKRFTARAFPDGENRRGIGFDKPFLDTIDGGPTCISASAESFGHTGFTGTMAWVDPKYDLIYLFLSNRINPNEWNTKLMKLDVRTDIQECIYQAIQTDKRVIKPLCTKQLLPIKKGVVCQ